MAEGQGGWGCYLLLFSWLWVLAAASAGFEDSPLRDCVPATAESLSRAQTLGVWHDSRADEKAQGPVSGLGKRLSTASHPALRLIPGGSLHPHDVIPTPSLQLARWGSL